MIFVTRIIPVSLCSPRRQNTVNPDFFNVDREMNFYEASTKSGAMFEFGKVLSYRQIGPHSPIMFAILLGV